LETLVHPTHDAAAHLEACSFDFKDEESTGDSAKLIVRKSYLSYRPSFLSSPSKCPVILASICILPFFLRLPLEIRRNSETHRSNSGLF
jgi:hypothetical protein